MIHITIGVYVDGSDTGYVALGYEVDYMSQGETIGQAIDRFVDGFNATIDEQVKQYGDPAHFLKATPPHRYGCVDAVCKITLTQNVDAKIDTKLPHGE